MMADKHSLNYDVRELKLGASFTNNKTSQYHTIKYDFKPASVDVNKMATVDVGTNNQVTVTVPHLDGAGVPQTVFKGSQRPYTKECVLIIDRVTGEITLEKLSSNIQVKKTRQESASKPRPQTPVTTDFTNTTQRSTSRTRVATNKRTANPSSVGPGGAPVAGSQPRFNAGAGGAGGALQKTPPTMVRSPQRFKTSSPQAPSWQSNNGNSTLASLPMIGLDDALGPAPRSSERGPPPSADRGPPPAERGPPPAERIPPPIERIPPPVERIPPPVERIPPPVERIPTHKPVNNMQPAPPQQDDSSSSSSSDSDSGSGSGSDSDSDDNDASNAPPPGGAAVPNGNALNPLTDVLNDDLCLSESGSDSD